MSIEKSEFRPKIVAFCCNWCKLWREQTWQGSSRPFLSGRRKDYPGALFLPGQSMFILRAFQKGGGTA